ncbi:glutamate--tRNA ligase [Holospora curviuscula]|uniref:Glutamate--tRNA ligase n=1 Tax=Holospora curviuscula TaxID=1082868 RepID=A0A2S5RI61_9PROT|nr:glutamate--tRNA ligase [Holospora curviuscula]PPE06912.1 Glutamate--tRNA ligase [Holospora curviuscula]
MNVVTRFAPSPTGWLHLGSARTALFNFLYARKYGGKFFLRIEDTDSERSTPQAVQQIFDALHWLRLDWDEPVVFQSQRRQRHMEVGELLLEKGMAYWCYCTPDRLQTLRETAKLQGKIIGYDRHCRSLDLPSLPGVSALRLKSPLAGSLHLNDHLKGSLCIQAESLDDMVLLRRDASPTYMLAVVVDDHDMEITHIIRGDDHLTNAFRQANLYHALGWCVPQLVHIPLIHGMDGAKLSKRHGAVDVQYYKSQGFFPEAVESALLRLGWAHGNEEKISRENALHWFDLDGLSPSPSRFDEEKLLDLNKYYIHHYTPSHLWAILEMQGDKVRGLEVLPELQKRAKTLIDLREHLNLYVYEEIPVIPIELLGLINAQHEQYLHEFSDGVVQHSDDLELFLKNFVATRGIKLPEFAKSLRIVLLGRTASVGLYHMLNILGPSWIIQRIRKALKTRTDCLKESFNE